MNKNLQRGGNKGKERGCGKIALGKEHGEYWRGERGGPEPFFEDGKSSKLNIEGQSLVIL